MASSTCFVIKWRNSNRDWITGQASRTLLTWLQIPMLLRQNPESITPCKPLFRCIRIFIFYICVHACILNSSVTSHGSCSITTTRLNGYDIIREQQGNRQDYKSLALNSKKRATLPPPAYYGSTIQFFRVKRVFQVLNIVDTSCHCVKVLPWPPIAARNREENIVDATSRENKRAAWCRKKQQLFDWHMKRLQ